jgi:UDP-glucose 4-epimerase
MKVLITGNMGYVGAAVSRELRASHPDWVIDGFDLGYFAHCLTGTDELPERHLNRQIFGDVRALPAGLLEGYDGVVQLAAISNDPMGNRFSAVTEDINCTAAVALAEAAARAGVRSMVYASSCSVYGVADGARSERDPVSPLTAYAKSKVEAEQALAAINAPMTTTCLRFATACGMSDRLRLDLVLNDFVASALVNQEITILSDGTPWRPLIDVRDMARAIDWALSRGADDGGDFLAVNVGREEANYQVIDLAEAVAAALPGVRISVNREAPADSRSYRVDFASYAKLAPNHQPVVSLDESIAGLVEGLTRAGFADPNFRNSQLMRLHVLDRHIAEGRLSERLEWVG